VGGTAAKKLGHEAIVGIVRGTVELVLEVTRHPLESGGPSLEERRHGSITLAKGTAATAAAKGGGPAGSGAAKGARPAGGAKQRSISQSEADVAPTAGAKAAGSVKAKGAASGASTSKSPAKANDAKPAGEFAEVTVLDDDAAEAAAATAVKSSVSPAKAGATAKGDVDAKPRSRTGSSTSQRSVSSTTTSVSSASVEAAAAADKAASTAAAWWRQCSCGEVSVQSKRHGEGWPCSAGRAPRQEPQQDIKQHFCIIDCCCCGGCCK
jgi:hypothetical protein